MSINLKRIFIVFIIIFMFLLSNVYAIDLFLSSQSNDTTPIATSQDDEIELGSGEKSVEISDNLEDSNEFVITYGNSVTQSENVDDEPYEITSAEVTSSPTITSTVAQDKTLSISDIINIILISVCIVLIFLAIAILIRCK